MRRCLFANHEGNCLRDLQELDASNMRELVERFPAMLNSLVPSTEIIHKIEKMQQESFAGVLLVGMGGSSISGSLCKELLTAASKPILLHRNSRLPSFVDRNWVVIGTSYSGNTSETISACSEAISRNCSVIAMTSGGTLKNMVQKDFLQQLPCGFPPRAAFPLIFSVTLPILEILMQMQVSNLKRTARNLERLRTKWKALPITPKQLAHEMFGKIPLFVGWRHLFPVAYRAKCQVNENAKSIAYDVEIPEANHNEIEATGVYQKHGIIPIFLRSHIEDNDARKAFDTTSEILAEQGCKTFELRMKAEDCVEEALSFIYHLDLTSVELAEARGVDPVAVQKISRLKTIMRS